MGEICNSVFSEGYKSAACTPGYSVGLRHTHAPAHTRTQKCSPAPACHSLGWEKELSRELNSRKGKSQVPNCCLALFPNHWDILPPRIRHSRLGGRMSQWLEKQHIMWVTSVSSRVCLAGSRPCPYALLAMLLTGLCASVSTSVKWNKL